jgi:hypothetical protein
MALREKFRAVILLFLKYRTLIRIFPSAYQQPNPAPSA